MKDNLLFIAKTLADIADDIDKLEENEVRYIIEKAEKMNPIGLIELYNSLGEYGKL